MADPEAIAELEDRLAARPPDRYPVLHATTSFHLGVLLTEAGRPDDAERVLDVAARLFADRLPTEHAKAVNARGAALRMSRRVREAADAFHQAASLFDAAGLRLESGAARFNIGLARRDDGDDEGALWSFEEARACLDPDRVPGQAAAVARELGTTLLTTGRLEEARDALESAVELSRRSGEPAALGAAANVLGLAELATGRPEDAMKSFRTAVAAHPRGVRPGEYAMAKANLALAYERAGDRARARLAAGQALGVTDMARPVRTQAAQLIERVGGGPGAVLPVLDQEAVDRWPVVLREEIVRWADADADERRAEVAAWIDGQLARAVRAQSLAEAWLGALLELPPEAMTGLIRVAVEELASREGDSAARFRGDVSRAMARFHVPQWRRLEYAFNRVAVEAGQEASWG